MGSLKFLSLALLFFTTSQVHSNNTQRKEAVVYHDREDAKIRSSKRISKTIFRLYESTVEEHCRIALYQLETLEQCNFNTSLPLVMIIHGWSINGMLEGWISKMAAALKSNQRDFNVIIADWLSLAQQHYPIAVRNTRLVGQEIADFLEWLELSLQYSRSKVHLIGYSLGAHVSGFAGTYISGSTKIGRITGLDPAGPLFEGMSSTDRLSPDDAHFVDAIHTFTQQHLGLSVGIKQPVAHYDFYPNGGAYQPGCHFRHVYNHIAQYGITGITQTVKCAHERSVHLFIDSLLHDDKQSMAYWCNDIHTFDKGICLSCRKNRCNTLGFNIRQERPQRSKRLYLKTRAHMPFKVYHYQFKIHFINHIQEKQLEPTFTVSLIGTKEDAVNLPITPVEEISGNKTYSFLITLDTDIGDIMMIKFKWKGTDMWAHIWDTVQTIIPWTKVASYQGFIVKTIRVKAGETQQKMTFCAQNVENVPLLPAQEKIYVRCENRLGRQKKKFK
ncbi:hepatic triacylglycerol lipase [Microcaecilia unicolor]|uniref:Hepatic triacylglycerol lipase n=1 Tax=Microcaecilia unicolor TaxID=1415580 RepID=A0A6P7WWI8_9AMPH|nr:hepatic triacylglycerol lipase [Microcaecilia unicolor]XP_030044703.1 hepatic triacylglycerol lipase [Microcaecilia unicolor]